MTVHCLRRCYDTDALLQSDALMASIPVTMFQALEVPYDTEPTILARFNNVQLVRDLPAVVKRITEAFAPLTVSFPEEPAFNGWNAPVVEIELRAVVDDGHRRMGEGNGRA